MYETYRMLGREHEADLEREARKRRLARQTAKSASKWPLLVVAVVTSARGVAESARRAAGGPSHRTSRSPAR
jgi:hypothetical protein